MRNFITPHCHPQSLDSASSVEDMVKRERELGTNTIVCTDHGTMAACYSVHSIATKNGVSPILGVEAYFRDDQCPILLSHGVRSPKEYAKYFHITLHAKDRRAYEALVRTLSRAPLERHGQELKPILNWKDLEELAKYRVCAGSGCMAGMVQRHILSHDSFRLAEAYYVRLREVMGADNFFAEIFPHDCSHFWVNAVFVHYDDGTQDKFYDGKKIKITPDKSDEDPLILSASDLVKKFRSRTWKANTQMLGVKHRHTWHEINKAIIKVEKVESFIRNEPRPWAPDGAYQPGCNRVVMILAEKYGDKILISDDSHFVRPEDKVVQDVRLQAGGGSWRFHESYHRKTSQEVAAYFRARFGTDDRTLEEWIDNSYLWAAGFDQYSLKSPPSLPTKFYPEDTLAHTMSLVRKHGRMRWDNDIYIQRLKEELAMLHQNGTVDLLPYFFIDEEVCSFFREQQLLTGPGRGSAAGLLLSYLLCITHVDPIQSKLSLERFITLDRIRSGSLPDIDQDVPRRDRELLVDPKDGWLVKRFGDHVIQISTDTALRLRSSIKDVCRVMYGTVPDFVNELTKKMQVAPQGVEDRDFIFGYAASDGSFVPGSIETDEALRAFVEHYPEAWQTVQQCLGLHRQKGRHPCSYVIANRPIHEFIPLTEVGGVQVTQYTAESVEAVGGLKMDFLGLNTLSDISDALRLIQERHGLNSDGHWTVHKGGVVKRVPAIQAVPVMVNGQRQIFDIWDLPADPKVFDEICQGKTETVFQLSTPSAVKWLRQFNHVISTDSFGQDIKAIHSIEGLAVFMALDRPGPLEAMVTGPNGQHNMLVEYARRVRGETPSDDIPPIFNQLLPETFGILCMQEQLQFMYQQLTGCTGPEAEEFRRNVAKKKVDKVQAVYPFFLERASQSLGQELAQQVWDFFQTWASYGFCKAHATSYAVIGYACAYLKYHFPLEWWTAVLRNANKNEINEKFWHHCSHLLMLPDICQSYRNFEIVDEKIQAPIDLLLGVGEAAHAQLCKYAPYSSLENFCQKIVQHQELTATEREQEKTTIRKLGHNAITRGVVRCMIVTGTMDALFAPDASLLDKFAEFEAAMRKMGKRAQKKDRLDLTHLEVNECIRYQMCKSILPAYSAPLLPLLDKNDHQRLLISTQEDGTYIYDKHPGSPRLMNAQELYLAGYEMPIAEPLLVASVAYVNQEKFFSFGPKKEKEGLALELDFGGDSAEYVQWGDWDSGKVAQKTKDQFPLKGSIVIVTMTKKNNKAPYVIIDIDTVSAPINK